MTPQPWHTLALPILLGGASLGACDSSSGTAEQTNNGGSEDAAASAGADDDAGNASGNSTTQNGGNTTGVTDRDASNTTGRNVDGASDGCVVDCEPVLCEGHFMLTSDQDFEEFVALGCTEVSGRLVIRNTSLTSLKGLVIRSVGDNLFVAANPSLETLAGLEQVTHIGGQLNIVNNAALASLGPLLDWPSDAVVGDLSIFSNSALPQCEVDEFVDQQQATCSNCTGNDAAGTCQ